MIGTTIEICTMRPVATHVLIMSRTWSCGCFANAFQLPIERSVQSAGSFAQSCPMSTASRHWSLPDGHSQTG